MRRVNLTWFLLVRALAGQQEEVILTGVPVQQGAVVEAEVNNEGHGSLTDHVILLSVRTHAPSRILSRVRSSSGDLHTHTHTHTHTEAHTHRRRGCSLACRRQTQVVLFRFFSGLSQKHVYVRASFRTHNCPRACARTYARAGPRQGIAT